MPGRGGGWVGGPGELNRRGAVGVCAGDEDADSSWPSCDNSGCSWHDSATVLYPATLGIDLAILLVFLVELGGRLVLKYWGMRNVFAYTLRRYNARYRKQGPEKFHKHSRCVLFGSRFD